MRVIILLFALLAAIAAGWYLRANVMSEPSSPPIAADSSGVVWEPITMEGAERARTAVEQLASSSGPVFANVGAADLASYVYVELSQQLPSSAEGVRAAVIGDRVYLKASVRLSELGVGDALGPFVGMVSERDTVAFGGTFDVLRPGLAQFRVRDLRVREFALPPRLIPRLLAPIRRGTIPEGTAEDGLPLQIPPHIADVRIANGRVTLYKNVP
jgi:hypothetical protein